MTTFYFVTFVTTIYLNIMRKAIFFLIIIISFNESISCSAKIKATLLKVEHMTNPTCVDIPTPRLSWINKAPSYAKFEKQTAYRIVVATSIEKLRKGDYDVWDTGKVQSDESYLIPYSGRELLPTQDYYWKVMVWNAKGLKSNWSTVAKWGMGLFKFIDWKAKWISTKQQTGAPLLRKTFEAEKKIKNAKVFVSAGGYFELYLNGKRIGDDYLSPNFTNYTKRNDLNSRGIAIDDNFNAYRVLYMSYEITKVLEKGTNCIGAILGDGFYKCNSRWVSSFGQPCLICQVVIQYDDGSSQIICSDDTWKTKPSAIIMDGVYDGEIYDARNETDNWSTIECDDIGWTQVDIVEGPIGELTAQTSPSDKITETIKPLSLTRQNDGSYLADFGKEISGWIRFKGIKCNSGDTLEVKYICESPLGKHIYIFKGNEKESYAPRFTWYVFSKAIIKCKSELNAKNIQAEAVNTEVNIDSEFSTSIPLLNNINEIWRRSQIDNMHGCVASDCPHRERSAYTGDGQIACTTVMLNFDAAAFYQKWIRDIRDSQNKSTGHVPNGAPWQPGCGGGVAWGAAMNIMPWEFYLQYGDKKMLSDNYEAMKKQLDYMLTWLEEDGTMFQKMGNVGSTEPNYWMNLGDWSPAFKNPEDNLVHTFYLWLCSHNTYLAASVLGNKEDAEHYEAIANSVRAAFHKRFYKPEGKTYGDYGSNIYALYMGGMDSQRKEEIKATLRKEITETYSGHINTGFIATKFFFETLSNNGMDDLAYRAMTKTDFPSYGYWIKQGATVTWEQWDGGNSHNHPMFGGGLTWLYRCLAGVNVTADGAGYLHFEVRPILIKGLEKVHYSKMTPMGVVAVDIINNNKVYQIDVTVPVGSNATVYNALNGEKLKLEQGHHSIISNKLKKHQPF